MGLVVGLLQVGTALADYPLDPVSPPRAAPDFALRDLSRVVHKLDDYAGRPLFVNFWATWCPPCREEIPAMNAAWEQLRGDGVAMLAIDVDEPADEVAGFVDQIPFAFPVLLDSSGRVSRAWGVNALPTTFLVDADGNIRYVAEGVRQWDDPALLEAIRALGVARAGPSGNGLIRTSADLR